MPIRTLMHCLAFCVIQTLSNPAAAQSTEDSFNHYILRAVDSLARTSAGQGYDINKAYSRNIAYGDGEVRASAPPLTMCVAAVAEVMITAIKLYAEESGDRSPYQFLPATGWNRMRPKDIRSHLWVDHRLDSFGTADALVTFGIGRRLKFKELSPGSFINLNRTNKSGHAVVFLSFLDRNGEPLAAWSPQVAGFRYFSAQGKGRNPDAGFGFRSAFFSYSGGERICPPRKNGAARRDCDVMYSVGQKYLNTGYMLHPKHWSAEQRDRNLKAVTAGLYQQSRTRGKEIPGLPKKYDQDTFETHVDNNDTLTLNPIFQHGNGTTDDE